MVKLKIFINLSALFLISCIYSCKVNQNNLESNVYKLDDFINSGNKDISVPLQNLLDNLPRSGGTIIFPKGNFKISQISIRGEENNKYKNLQLIGSETNLVLKKNSKPNAILIENVQNVEIKNLKIDGNKNYQKKDRGSGLRIRYCDNVKISNVSIENCVQSGIWLNTILNLLIQDSNFSNNGINKKAFFSDGITAANIFEGTIKNNICNYNNPKRTMDGDGIQIGTTINHPFLQKQGTINIIGNICIGNGRRGIKIQRSNVNVEGNNIHGNKAKQIAIVQDYSINNIKVTENTIGKKGTNSMQSIVIHSGNSHKAVHENILISQNTFNGSFVNEGILIDDCKDIILEKNKLNFDANVKAEPQIRITSRCQNSSIQNVPGLKIINKGKNIDIQ